MCSITPTNLVSKAFASQDKRAQHYVIKFPSNRTITSAKLSPRISSPSLGGLGELPFEVLDDIIDHLDLSSLETLRAVNSTSKHLIDTYRPYQDVIQHAHEQYQIILNMDSSAEYNIRQIHRVLLTSICSSCNEAFAPFVQLIDMTRTCFSCLETSTKYTYIDRESAKLHYSVSDDTVFDTLPSFTTFPGLYSPSAMSSTISKQMFYKDDILALLSQRYSSLVASLIHSTQTRLGDKAFYTRYMGAIYMPVVDRVTRAKINTMCCMGCKAEYEELLPTTVADSEERSVSWSAMNKEYTQEEFKKHLKECVHSQGILARLEESKVETLGLETSRVGVAV